MKHTNGFLLRAVLLLLCYTAKSIRITVNLRFASWGGQWVKADTVSVPMVPSVRQRRKDWPVPLAASTSASTL